MATTVKYQRNAGKLTASVEFVRGAPASYTLILWEVAANKKVFEASGNFKNDDDDEYSLLGMGENNGRHIEVMSIIPKLPGKQPPKLKVTVRQNGKVIGSVERPNNWFSDSTLVDIWILLEAK